MHSRQRQTGACLYIRMGTTAVAFKNLFCAPDFFPACLFSPVEFLRRENYLSVSTCPNAFLRHVCHEFLAWSGGATAAVERDRRG
jgi:hypothetical protein